MQWEIAVLSQKTAPKALFRFSVRDKKVKQKSTDHDSPNSTAINPRPRGVMGENSFASVLTSV